jgi:protein-disulfide isomerase
MGKDRMEAGRRGEGSGVVKGQGKKNATAAVRRGDNKRWFYIALAAIVVGGIAALSWLSTRSSATVTQVDTTLPPIPNQGHVMGSDSAPLEVVEFGDFECPACGSFATLTEPDVKARLVNTGLIRFRYVDFPLSMHPNAWPAHLASWCAGEQGKFWEMHDAIFMNQDRWNTQATNRPERVLSGLAQQVGVNMDQYEGCMSSRKYQQQVRANVDEGIRRSVGGTPTFFIGNLKIDRPLSYDQFKKYVDDALPAARAAKAGTKTAPTGTKTAPR